MSFCEGYSVCQQLNLSVLLLTSQTTMNVLQQVYLSIQAVCFLIMTVIEVVAQYDVQFCFSLFCESSSAFCAPSWKRLELILYICPGNIAVKLLI